MQGKKAESGPLAKGPWVGGGGRIPGVEHDIASGYLYPGWLLY